MRTIGILGTGNVGRVLATGLAASGRTVAVGSRTPERPLAWVDAAPGRRIRLTDLPGAAAADVVVNALPGHVAVRSLGELRGALAGKVLVDVANAVEHGPDGFASALLYPGGSLAEAIQRELPDIRVVKTLNTMGPAELMAAPATASAPPSAFLSADDSRARAVARELLADLGWPAEWIVDLGGLATAWWPESFILMVRPLVAALGPVPFGLAIAR
ncbi:NAD(P)-binding domain-containing protein [Micromonospora sp. NPDC049559]|uniref:NADPH-dependent F420 reductase n=1 Tax=Micromonospora sp. NPDC049559 TaxID=3155923 RepID=UPI0034275F7D